MSKCPSGIAYMPLWIVQADKSVIDGHNDFLNDHFVDFIRQVYYTILRDGDDKMDEMRQRGQQRTNMAFVATSYSPPLP